MMSTPPVLPPNPTAAPPALPPNPTILPPELWGWVGERLRRSEECFRLTPATVYSGMWVDIYRGDEFDQRVMWLPQHDDDVRPTRTKVEEWIRDVRNHVAGNGLRPFGLNVTERFTIEINRTDNGKFVLGLEALAEEKLNWVYREERLVILAHLIEQIAHYYRYEGW